MSRTCAVCKLPAPEHGIYPIGGGGVVTLCSNPCAMVWNGMTHEQHHTAIFGQPASGHNLLHEDMHRIAVLRQRYQAGELL